MAIPDHVFVHHVYFWLKDPADSAARDAIIAGLTRLKAAPDILWSHIGVPAPSPRGVVDGSYAVSWLILLADKDAEDRYQVDPIHLEFVETCAQHWDRVVVYDSREPN